MFKNIFLATSLTCAVNSQLFSMNFFPFDISCSKTLSINDKDFIFIEGKGNLENIEIVSFQLSRHIDQEWIKSKYQCTPLVFQSKYQCFATEEDQTPEYFIYDHKQRNLTSSESEEFRCQLIPPNPGAITISD